MLDDPKTLEGTELALRSLALIKKGAEVEAPSGLEQPRRTKMKKLEEWQYLIDSRLAYETWLASCVYGSIHQKEFVFLATFEEFVDLHRKCPRNHVRTKIQGKYTKGSAIYTDALAEGIATAYDRALTRKLRVGRLREPRCAGLENVLVNDLLISHTWKAWTWKKPCHINIQEPSVERASVDFTKDPAKHHLGFKCWTFCPCQR